MRAFLAGTEPMEFEAKDQASLYEWVTGTLRAQGYARMVERGERAGEAVHRQSDGTEPGASDTPDRVVHRSGRGEDPAFAATPLPGQV